MPNQTINRTLFALIVFYCGFTATATQAQDPEQTLLSYEAVYRLDSEALKLLTKGVVSATGTRTITVLEKCLSWYQNDVAEIALRIGETEQKLSVGTDMLEGKKDISQLTFTHYAELDGKLMMLVEGGAFRQTDGRIDYYFDGHKAKLKMLSADMLLPQAAKQTLINELSKGKQSVALRRFDGRFIGGGMWSAAIAEPPPGDEAISNIDSPLLKAPSWSLVQSEASLGEPVESDLFLTTSRVETRLFASGVASRMTLDTARLKGLTFVLESVKPLEKMACSEDK